MSGPLEGIRVLDLSRVLSGPFASMHLADMGADVVKVEPPGGDETRRFGPPFVQGESGAESAYFLAINRGKRSIVLDLAQAGDLALARRLASRADVLLTNFRPGLLERRGLDPVALRQEHPHLVVCRISGFGPDDPRGGYDNVVQALSGIPSLTGPPEGGPAKCGASIADLVAGHNAAQAVLAGLLQRERGGQGCLVDVGMLDGMLDLLVYHAVGWLGAGAAPERQFNAHTSVHPLQTYPTSDGHLALAVGNDLLFAKLCEVLGLPELAADPRFATNPDRVAGRDALDAILGPRLAAMDSATAEALLQEAGLPAGAVRTVPQALEAARLLVHDHPHGGRPFSTVAPPWSFDGKALGAHRRPPRLDEHREEILAQWLNEPVPSAPPRCHPLARV